MTDRYRAFISYSHSDESTARWLHRALERYRPPRAISEQRLAPIFRDRDELGAEGSLPAALEEALRASACLIVICSPVAAASSWVNEEIRFFAEHRDRSRIYCLIASGESPAVFPPALRALDDDSGAEPLAADLGRESRRAVLLKMAAALLEVRYDDLARREESRRARRLVTMAGAATAGFAVMTALASFALFQRAEAVRQEALAVREAEVANEVASYLVDLFQIADPQTENPDTITARTLLERGSAGLGERLDERPDIKARLLYTIGKVEGNLGLLESAEQTLLKATELAELTDERSAEIWITTADIQSRMSQLDEAESRLQAVTDFASANADILTPPIALKLHTTWATVLYLQSRPEAARAHAETAASLAEQEHGPRSMERGRALSLLGNIYVNLEEMQLAETTQLESLAIQEAVLGPEHIHTAIAAHNLAETQMLNGNFEQGIESERKALGIFAALLDESHPYLAQAHRALALGHRGLGEPEVARSHFETALSGGRQAFGDNHGFVALTLSDMAFAYADLDMRQEAYDALAESRALFAELMGDGHDYVIWTHVLEAQVAAQLDERPAERRACEEAALLLAENPDVAEEYRSLWSENCGSRL